MLIWMQFKYSFKSNNQLTSGKSNMHGHQDVIDNEWCKKYDYNDTITNLQIKFHCNTILKIFLILLAWVASWNVQYAHCVHGGADSKALGA